ncbi:MAG: hypothetical protein ACO29W_18950, partial [Burkholderiaceae bacterium]
HHASLRIDSEPGKGSVFTLRFPARRLVADAPAVVAYAESPSDNASTVTDPLLPLAEPVTR